MQRKKKRKGLKKLPFLSVRFDNNNKKKEKKQFFLFLLTIELNQIRDTFFFIGIKSFDIISFKKQSFLTDCSLRYTKIMLSRISLTSHKSETHKLH